MRTKTVRIECPNGIMVATGLWEGKYAHGGHPVVWFDMPTAMKLLSFAYPNHWFSSGRSMFTAFYPDGAGLAEQSRFKWYQGTNYYDVCTRFTADEITRRVEAGYRIPRTCMERYE